MLTRISILALLILALQGCANAPLRGTGDLGLVIERATGSVEVVETTDRSVLGRVAGLGDLSHASVKYSRDGRYAYVFGRDGGLTKVDLLKMCVIKRVMQSGNSIGGSISQDGKLVAVANYTPGGIKVFDSSTLDLVADIPALDACGACLIAARYGSEILKHPRIPYYASSPTSARNPTMA